MKFLIKFFLPVLVSGLFMQSCSEYQKTLKGNNFDKKYDLAVKFYEKKDYFRASSLLEDLLPISRGTKRSETVFYYYAYSQYGLGEYLMAAYHFENFVRTFPASEHAEEAMYMTAYCYYLDSPVYSLDQTNTAKAINEIQLFINKYPLSPRVKECNEIMDKLRAKLEQKAYENAVLYYNMEDYKSSVYSFRNLLKDFPDTKYREEAFYYIVRGYYQYGINSVDEKKAERMSQTIEAYHAYVDAYGTGKYLRDAQTLFENARKQLEKAKKTDS